MNNQTTHIKHWNFTLRFISAAGAANKPGCEILGGIFIVHEMSALGQFSNAGSSSRRLLCFCLSKFRRPPEIELASLNISFARLRSFPIAIAPRYVWSEFAVAFQTNACFFNLKSCFFSFFPPSVKHPWQLECSRNRNGRQNTSQTAQNCDFFQLRQWSDGIINHFYNCVSKPHFAPLPLTVPP